MPTPEDTSCDECDTPASASSTRSPVIDMPATVGRGVRSSTVALLSTVSGDMLQAASPATRTEENSGGTSSDSFASVQAMLEAVAELSADSRAAEQMPPHPQEAIPVAMPLVPQCTRCGGSHSRVVCVHACMECAEPWPAHKPDCALQYDPVDQRLAVCANAIQSGPIADIEEGEIFTPVESRTRGTSLVASVPAFNRMLETLTDEEVIARYEPSLTTRYMRRLPSVWDMPPRQWLRCASEAQLANICRAVALVENRVAEHTVPGSVASVLTRSPECQRELAAAFRNLQVVVSAVADDLVEIMGDLVSA